jgi:hypothetical protein
MIPDAEFDSDLQNVWRPQTVSASGIGADTPQISGTGRSRCVVFLGSISGGGAFTAKLEHSHDGSTWVDVPGGAFAALSTAPAGASLGIGPGIFRKFIRLNYTLTGTTPSATGSAFIVTRRQYA